MTPGRQTCAWLEDANFRSQFGHTQRATPPIVPHQQTSLTAATLSCEPLSTLVVEFPLVAGARLSTVSGLWRSLVAHLTGGQGVASSNLAVPTVSPQVSDAAPRRTMRCEDSAPLAVAGRGGCDQHGVGFVVVDPDPSVVPLSL